MPVLEESELQRIYQSVAGFSEDAMRYAIEQAREPEKGAQLAERLRGELVGIDAEFPPFSMLAMIVVLGEAKVEPAIPDLLAIASDPAKVDYIIRDAAAYALQRMGPPALFAAMTHIENSPQAGARVLGYEILHAAMDADDQTRLAVADFCLSRAGMESGEDEEGWDARAAVLHALVALRERRAESLLEELREKAESEEETDELEGFAEDLAAGDRPEYDVDWRTDWPEQCAQWDEMLEELAAGPISDEKLAELDAAHAELVREYTELVRGYTEAAPEFSIRQDQVEKLGKYVQSWLDFAAEFGVDARSLDYDLTRQVLLERTPAEMIQDPTYFQAIGLLLGHFFIFLGYTGRLPDAERFHELAEEAERHLPALAKDERNWSLNKRLYMTGESLGYDMESEQGAFAFMRRLLEPLEQAMSKVGPEHSAAEPNTDSEEADWDEVTMPIRREAPKVGRNDPCPCGSGKKYKKCCGK